MLWTARGESERTDEELATSGVDGDLIAVIPSVIWFRLRWAGLEHVVLVAGEYGGADAVAEIVGQYGCRREQLACRNYLRRRPERREAPERGPPSLLGRGLVKEERAVRLPEKPTSRALGFTGRN